MHTEIWKGSDVSIEIDGVVPKSFTKEYAGSVDWIHLRIGTSGVLQAPACNLWTSWKVSNFFTS
jgi:hypothetical protein